jgi:hypothetical protein
MTASLSNDETPRDGQALSKAPWARSTLEVTEINSSTQAGAATVGDLDSNDVS